MDSAKRVISGTWGEVWLDGDKVSECYGAQGKVEFNKDEIAMCGTMFVDQKVTSLRGRGSLRLHKTNSRMALAIGEAIQNGQDIRFSVISKLKDPDAYGAERVSFTGVSFDDLTLADWEAKSVGKVEMPFTFTGFKLLDVIAPR